jgi:hypothetical protein
MDPQVRELEAIDFWINNFACCIYVVLIHNRPILQALSQIEEAAQLLYTGHTTSPAVQVFGLFGACLLHTSALVLAPLGCQSSTLPGINEL